MRNPAKHLHTIGIPQVQIKDGIFKQVGHKRTCKEW